MGRERVDGWTVRLAVADDAAELADLQIDVWEQAYRGLMPDTVLEERRAGRAARVDRWLDNLSTSHATTTVAAGSGGLIGFASVGPHRDPEIEISTELWALYTRSEWWGSGVGHDLLAAALGDGRAYLWVLRGNDRAVGFYSREGFRGDGMLRQDRYGAEVRMCR